MQTLFKITSYQIDLFVKFRKITYKLINYKFVMKFIKNKPLVSLLVLLNRPLKCYKLVGFHNNYTNQIFRIRAATPFSCERT